MKDMTTLENRKKDQTRHNPELYTMYSLILNRTLLARSGRPMMIKSRGGGTRDGGTSDR